MLIMSPLVAPRPSPPEDLTSQKETLEVNIEDVMPLFICDLEEWRPRVDAGGIDENIHPAETFDRGLSARSRSLPPLASAWTATDFRFRSRGWLVHELRRFPC